MTEATPSVPIEPSSITTPPSASTEAATAPHNLAGLDLSALSQLIDTGGPVVLILMGMSIVAMTVFFIKLWQLIGIAKANQPAVLQALASWHQQKPTQAISQLNKTSSPLARVLKTAMFLRNQADADETSTREEVMRLAKRELASARSHLRILEVIATLSPLLGLLGTVLGMIVAFQKLQGAGTAVDPSVLSGGIWEALLTTAAGLIVAIPTVIGLNWLEQRIENFKLLLEDTITQVFTAHLPQASNSATVEPIQKRHATRASKPVISNDAALAT